MNSTSWLKNTKTWIGVGFGVWLCILPLAAIAIEFKPPKRSLPGRREGGGTRGPACVQGSPNLTVLLPQTNLGLTTVAYPQFFWFTPKTLAKSIQFTLYQGTDQDPTQEIVYETTLNTPAQPGVMGLTLPKDANVPPLSVGRDYFWTVSLLCQPDDPTKNIEAEGWIQRVPVESALAEDLKVVKPGDRPQLYAQNGIWFETLATLAELRCANTQNSALTKSWSQLLSSAKLDRLAEQPLSQVCQK